MFGYVVANVDALTQEEKLRYRGLYCGLCWTLKERHGDFSRMTLNYDMVFLALILSSIYEPSEEYSSRRCLIHPLENNKYYKSVVLDYVADMNVLLAYYNCQDDWVDDKKLTGLAASKMLALEIEQIKSRWPRQCKAVEYYLDKLSEYEKNDSKEPDRVAECFGRLLGEIFVWKENDDNTLLLRDFGHDLGQFVYSMDACCDLESDIKKNRYNAFTELFSGGEDPEPMLTMLISQVTSDFERLDLKKDIGIMKNILYSGVWARWRIAQSRTEGKKQ